MSISRLTRPDLTLDLNCREWRKKKTGYLQKTVSTYVLRGTKKRLN